MKVTGKSAFSNKNYGSAFSSNLKEKYQDFKCSVLLTNAFENKAVLVFKGP